MSSPGKNQLDAMYPEPLSRLRRGNSDLPGSASYRRAVKKQLHRGNSGRFRTQPVTFHEIKEVDEENLVETEAETSGTVGAESKSESDLKAKFELFYRSIKSSHDNCGPPLSLPCNRPKGAAPLNLAESGTSGFPAAASVVQAPLPTIHTLRPRLVEQDARTQCLAPAASLDSQSQPSPAATSAPLAIPFNPRSRPSL